MSIKSPLSLIPSKIQKMLEEYAEDLEQAWGNAGDDPLTISFGAKLGMVKGKNICEVSISFTKERIKDTITFEWSALQGELFNTIILGDETDLPDLDKAGYMKKRDE